MKSVKSRTEEALTVVVNHVSRVFNDPDFSFPTDFWSPFSEGPQVLKHTDKDLAKFAFCGQSFQCKVSDWTDGV